MQICPSARFISQLERMQYNAHFTESEFEICDFLKTAQWTQGPF